MTRSFHNAQCIMIYGFDQYERGQADEQDEQEGCGNLPVFSMRVLLCMCGSGGCGDQ